MTVLNLKDVTITEALKDLLDKNTTFKVFFKEQLDKRRQLVETKILGVYYHLELIFDHDVALEDYSLTIISYANEAGVREFYVAKYPIVNSDHFVKISEVHFKNK